MSNFIGIVDAYSSGNLLAPYFRERGFQLIHIQSQETVPSVYSGSFHPNDFDEQLIHVDLEKSIGVLTKLDVKQVIAGSEPSVELADLLSQEIGVLSNGTEMSAARRDKYLMAQALQRSGVRRISGTATSKLDIAVRWARNRYPIVVKPKRSAGSDNVWLCNSVQELERAFHRIIQQSTCFGERNEAVLLQEHVSGVEYIVDVVRCEDAVAVAQICRYGKKMLDGAFVYDFIELLPATGKVQSLLSSYAVKVLDALGVRYGPAHLEVIIDAKGPVLVEMGARLDGGGAPILCRAATRQDQAEMTVICYTDQNEFKARAAESYSIHQHYLRVNLISQQSGVVAHMPYLDELQNLQSFLGAARLLGVGNKIVKTVNHFDLPGIIDLMHSSKEVIWRDYEKIRKWEKSGFFQLA